MFFESFYGFAQHRQKRIDRSKVRSKRKAGEAQGKLTIEHRRRDEYTAVIDHFGEKLTIELVLLGPACHVSVCDDRQLGFEIALEA